MEIGLIIFQTKESFQSKDVEKLRGYIANIFSDNILTHNHIDTYRFNYKMPKIQYKLIENKLAIYGIAEGAEFIRKNIINLDKLYIDGEVIKDFNKHLYFKNEEFEVRDELFLYKFITPWLALNENNYMLFKKGELDLNRLLQNNILSNFKGCDIRINKRIMVKGDFKPMPIYMKDTELVGFKGDFICNVKIPKFMALGKRKSIGYGTIIPA